MLGKVDCIARLEDALAGKNSVKAAAIKEEKAAPKVQIHKVQLWSHCVQTNLVQGGEDA